MTFELILPLLLLCCLACQIKPQGDNEASASKEFVDRVIHGAREIAEYMGVSAATITRWRTRFRGTDEIRLCFPAFLTPTGKGWGFRMTTSTVLIKVWMQRWAEIDTAEAQKKAKWRRKPSKVKRMGETSKGPGAAPIEGKERPSLREEPPVEVISRPEPSNVPLPGPPVNPLSARRQSGIQRPEGCVCGTGLDCYAHGEPA